jgi:hypothetical protein
MSLPSFSSVVWSAFRAGACQLVAWRASAHASSQRVAEAFFVSAPAAAAFARRWALRLGLAVRVRRSHAGWSVSVPVVAWPSAGAGAVVCGGQCGGVLGVARGLRQARALSLVSSFV